MFLKGLKRGHGNRMRPFSELKFLILKCIEICYTLAQDVLPRAKQCFIDGHAILLLQPRVIFVLVVWVVQNNE